MAEPIKLRPVAWTEPGGTYPAYINIRTNDDEVVISVRSKGDAQDKGGNINMGSFAALTIPKSEFEKLIAEFQRG